MRALFLLLFFVARAALADDVVTIVVKKQEEKKAARWSISDWLETRDKMRLMDLWLALHSPSPYEFFVGVGSSFSQATPGDRYQAWNAEVTAYASIFGITMEREISQAQRYAGFFDLRVFGFHDQGTNITLQGGLRHTNDFTSAYRSAAAGGALTLYLNKFFGLRGQYRHYFDSTADSAGFAHSGALWHGEFFIDFRALRLFCAYDTESEAAGGADLATRAGPALGGRFYF